MVESERTRTEATVVFESQNCLASALNMSFRRSAVVIIDCGRNVIRAGRGVGEELLPAPSIVSDDTCVLEPTAYLQECV